MYLLGFAGTEIMKSVRDFIQTIFVVFAGLWYWPVVFVGLMILAVVVLFTLVRKSYENKILKSVNKLNKYFLAKPFITEENLVEFNLKMKNVPKVLRNNWQIYMLNREDSPTKYINVDTCIDKPLKTGSIEKNMHNFTTFSILLAILSFVVGLQYASVMQENQFIPILFSAVVVPLLIAIIYTVTILIVRASKNDIYANLYDNFPLYERNLTKAVTTLPAYVDYEILFTKKEIKEGIPILQQYLEKRALVEQQELEKAREGSVAVEQYDFSDLGVDGSLILERSMKESETFIKIKRRLQDEIGSIETEMSNYKKNYEETLKDMQRKLQASRENLESLKTQQEESTNRIESNYIRKQQADEIKKQQQLEKDIEEATTKYNDEQTSLKQDIEKREKEIAEKKEFVEQAMSLEFKHYANILYKALTEKATEVGNQKLLTLAQENSDLKVLLTDMQGVGGANVDIQENLIQNQDLTSENLYDMSSSDMTQLDEAREQTENDENNKKETNDAQKLNSEPASQQDDLQQASQVAIETQKENLDESSSPKAQESVEQVAEKIETKNEDDDDEKKLTSYLNDDKNLSSESDNQNLEQQNASQEDNQSLAIDNEKMADNAINIQETNPSQEINSKRADDNVTSLSKNSDENDLQKDLAKEKMDIEEPSSRYTGNASDNSRFEKEQAEDLEQIQRQIDENNKILQKNKEEFENDLNKTISKIDDSSTDGYDYMERDRRNLERERDDEPRYERTRDQRTSRDGDDFDTRGREDYSYRERSGEYQEETRRERAYRDDENFRERDRFDNRRRYGEPQEERNEESNYRDDEDLEPRGERSSRHTSRDRFEEEEKAPRKRRATSRRIVDDEPRRSETNRRGARRPVTTSRSRRESDGGNDIDELNAEMQKLLGKK